MSKTATFGSVKKLKTFIPIGFNDDKQCHVMAICWKHLPLIDRKGPRDRTARRITDKCSPDKVTNCW